MSPLLPSPPSSRHSPKGSISCPSEPPLGLQRNLSPLAVDGQLQPASGDRLHAQQRNPRPVFWNDDDTLVDREPMSLIRWLPRPRPIVVQPHVRLKDGLHDAVDLDVSDLFEGDDSAE